MQELRQMLTKMNYQNVRTYIQSGNILLDSKQSKTEIAKEIHVAIDKKYGYNVPVIVRTVKELEKIIKNNPYSLDKGKSIYFTFLDRIPSTTQIVINAYDSDEFTLIGDVVYLSCMGGYGNSKLTNNIFEKKLDVKASTRNYRTTLKLLELANQSYE